MLFTEKADFHSIVQIMNLKWAVEELLKNLCPANNFKECVLHCELFNSNVSYITVLVLKQTSFFYLSYQ